MSRAWEQPHFTEEETEGQRVVKQFTRSQEWLPRAELRFTHAQASELWSHRCYTRTLLWAQGKGSSLAVLQRKLQRTVGVLASKLLSFPSDDSLESQRLHPHDHGASLPVPESDYGAHTVACPACACALNPVLRPRLPQAFATSLAGASLAAALELPRALLSPSCLPRSEGLQGAHGHFRAPS